MCESFHGRHRSFLLLFAVLGDTYLQKHIVKSTFLGNFCILGERYSTFWAPAWPGPPGWPGLRLKWAKDRFGSKKYEKVKALRMEFSIVENLSGLQESVFSLSRGPQVHFGEKSKKCSNFIKFTDFPPFPLFGVPWAAVIFPLCTNGCLGSCAGVMFCLD